LLKTRAALEGFHIVISQTDAQLVLLLTANNDAFSYKDMETPGHVRNLLQ
jgi:hypothetical protein